jgi:hypothetical protein
VLLGRRRARRRPQAQLVLPSVCWLADDCCVDETNDRRTDDEIDNQQATYNHVDNARDNRSTNADANAGARAPVQQHSALPAHRHAGAQLQFNRRLLVWQLLVRHVDGLCLLGQRRRSVSVE